MHGISISRSLAVAALGLVLVLAMATCGLPAGESSLGSTTSRPGTVSTSEARAALTPRSQQAPASPVAVAPGFDLGAVVAQVHHAYRPDGEAFASEHSTYSVRVEAGRAHLTPRHWSVAQRSEDLSSRRYLEGAPLQIETVEIRRAAAARGEVRARGAVYRSGSLRIPRRHATELLRNQDQGVEQSWRFERAPAGRGDLLVRVRAEGLRYAGESAKGLHFSDPASGLGFRYGHATWIDAREQRKPVAVRWRDGQIEMRVPEAWLGADAFPALLDPLISPEIGMDQPVLAPAGAEQQSPTAASDGSGYLVVWQDNRRGYYYDVYAARVSSSGQLLDDYGIPVAVGDKSQSAPAVASDGTGYFVVWQHYGSMGQDVYGARVSSAGAVLDSTPIAINTDSGSQSEPSVSYDGSQYLVVWHLYQSGDYNLFGARVSTAGQVLDSSPITISDAADDQRYPVVASTGSGFLVAWEDERNGVDKDVYAARVSAAGALLDTNGIAVLAEADKQSRVSIASNGSNYLLVWEDRRPGPNCIYGGRVSSSGQLLDPGGFGVASGGG